MICMTSIRENIPEIEGSVMFQNLRNTPAPSIIAASYSSWLTPCRLARYKMAVEPKPFQVIMMTMQGMTRFWFCSQGMASMPKIERRELRRPEVGW